MVFAPPVRRLHTSTRQAFKLWKLLASEGQLPLSQRQSQQLLNALKESFRTQLDREHPPSASDLIRPAPDLPALPAPASTQPHTLNSRSSTDQHLRSILNNPLLAIKPTHESASSPVTDYLSWFREQVALGVATVHQAADCLAILEAEGYLTPDGSGNTRAKKEGVGSLILDWINISGKATSQTYIKSYPLIIRLTKFVQAEDREDVVLDWLGLSPSIALKCEFDLKDFQQWKVLVMTTFVNSHLANDVDTGLTAYLRLLNVLKLQDPTNRYTPRKAGLNLVKQLVSMPEGKTLKCSPTLYEDVTAQTTTLGSNAPFFEAFLWLHHPTNRKTSFAMDLIKRDFDKTLVTAQRQGKMSTDWLEIFYYDLMQRLLDEGSNIEAVEVLGKVQSYKKAAVVPLAVKKRSPRPQSNSKTVDRKGEAESLSFLRALGLT